MNLLVPDQAGNGLLTCRGDCRISELMILLRCLDLDPPSPEFLIEKSQNDMGNY